LADQPHPEVTGNLDQTHRCIIVTVAGADHTATFKTDDPAAAFWSGSPPCPDWALAAVREWTRTPSAIALYRQLAQLQGRPPADGDLTPVDRPAKG
jgi:hypothetical protein